MSEAPRDSVPRGHRGRKRAIPRLRRVIAHLDGLIEARETRIAELLDASVADGERVRALKKQLSELEAQ